MNTVSSGGGGGNVGGGKRSSMSVSGADFYSFFFAEFCLQFEPEMMSHSSPSEFLSSII
jgi:hypothetical protein